MCMLAELKKSVWQKYFQNGVRKEEEAILRLRITCKNTFGESLKAYKLSDVIVLKQDKQRRNLKKILIGRVRENS